MFSAPNYTQTPNDFFDEVLPTLKGAEMKVLLVVMRQTFGWQKRWDCISLTQMKSKTGLTTSSITSAVKSLTEKKLLITHKTGTPGNEETYYSLAVTDSKPDPTDEDEFSHNSYQSKISTGGGPKIRPTKETTTKEIYPPNPPKGGKSPPLRDRAPHVKTTDQEHERLCKEFGEILIQECYQHLSEWKEDQPKKKRNGDDNRKIRNWVVEAVLKKRKSKKFVSEELKKTGKKQTKSGGNVPKWLQESE